MNFYILLVPLTHDNIEDIVDKSLGSMLTDIVKDYPVSVDIYLESETRTYAKKIKSSKKIIKYGLEDPVLLGLFELSIYMMSIRDPRIYEQIYEGMGRLDPDTEQKRKDARLSTLALKVAKGSESILNLRDSTITEFKDLTNDFNIDELVSRKYDEDYIYEYSLKLERLYENLVSLMSRYEEYTHFIDFKYIKDLMNTVTVKENLEVSEVISMRLKTYLMIVRNHSNLQFVFDKSYNYGDRKIAIILTGNAHIPDYKLTLNSMGVGSEVLEISKKEEDVSDSLFESLDSNFKKIYLGKL